MGLVSREEILSLYTTSSSPSDQLPLHSPFVSTDSLLPLAFTPHSHTEQDLLSSSQWVLVGPAAKAPAPPPPATARGTHNKQPFSRAAPKPHREEPHKQKPETKEDTTADPTHRRKVSSGDASLGNIGRSVNFTRSQVERDFNSSWRRKDENGLHDSEASLGQSVLGSLDAFGVPVSLDSMKSSAVPIGGPFLPRDHLFQTLPIVRQWWYEDLHGIIQGPFSSEQMKEWYYQGYIPLTLPVRSSPLIPFILLKDLFKSGDKAFLDFVPIIMDEPVPIPTVPAFHNNTASTPALEHGLNEVSRSVPPSSESNRAFGVTNDQHSVSLKHSTMKSSIIDPWGLTSAEKAESFGKDDFVDTDAQPAELPNSPSQKSRMVSSKQKNAGSVETKASNSSDDAMFSKEEDSTVAETAINGLLPPKGASEVANESFAVVGKKAKKSSGKELSKNVVSIKKEEKPFTSVSAEKKTVDPTLTSHTEAEPEESAIEQRQPQVVVRDPRTELPSWSAKPATQLSLKEIMELEEKEARKAKQEEQIKKYTMAARVAKTGWAGVATVQAPKSVGLLEIMQEQEKKTHSRPPSMASALAKNSVPTPVSSGAWSSMVASAPAVSLRQIQEDSKKKSGGSSQSVWQGQDSKTTTHGREYDDDSFFWDSEPAPPIIVKTSSGSGTATAPVPVPAGNSSRSVPGRSQTNEFGGPSLPLEFLAWCKKQLTSITGNDDLTLVTFLASLKSADAIRDYIYEYLGRSSDVEDFANEFIRQKDFIENPAMVVASKGRKAVEEEGNLLVASGEDSSKKSKKKKKKKAVTGV